MTNQEVLAAYDANTLIRSIRISPGSAEAHEWAGQIIVMEVLREFLEMDISLDAYNAMSQDEWDDVCLRAYARAAEHLTAPVGELPERVVARAFGIGGTYFEHGYQAIVDQSQDTITFQYQP